MRFIGYLIIGVLSCTTEPLLGQTVETSSADSILINLSARDDSASTYITLDHSGWKFSPENSPDYSNLNFDDSAWHTLAPHPDSVLAAKDSLWKGHGWFRITFTVDSSFYDTPRSLSFNAYGAAEIFIDGKKLAEYGSPSTARGQEVLPTTLPKMYPAMNLIPKKKHVLAFRYSFHKYEDMKRMTYSGNLDLGVHIHIHRTEENIADYQSKIIEREAFVIVMGITLLITLLHLVFYFKFPQEKSNLWVFLVTLHLSVLVVMLIQSRYFEIVGWVGIVMVYVFSYAYFQFFSMVPKALQKLSKTEEYPLWKYLPATGIPLAILHFILQRTIDPNIANLFPILIAGLVLVAGFLIIWEARNLKREKIWIIASGFLTIPVVILITIAVFIITFFSPNIPDDYLQIYMPVAIVIAFISLPMCMSMYVGSMFFELYGDLETKVRERTKELHEKNSKLESANQKIKEQHDEVVEARNNLQKALDDLKATQEQLVQQEKLASLGQLTAGIAHEIKNPLNFVNNFSDLSVELVEEVREELQGERAKGKSEKVDEALAILDDVEANLRKIHEHGSRADSIVKSMLQHSRGGSGEMEPTNLNALVKEYVNLSFHGMRASEEPINVDIEMELDESVGEVPLIAEDFSRVIVNLCNNAFDAMREKLNSESRIQNSKEYKPKLTIRSQQSDTNVIIEIEDNGPGIPEEMKDKIMQPFFTTKKGTEGTGLGLSITNDIIKAHAGSLDIDSKAGEFTIFKIKIEQ